MGGSLTREIIIFILVYESSDDRRTLAQTHTGEPKARRYRRVIKREKRRKTAEAGHLMMLLECVTELSYVNR